MKIIDYRTDPFPEEGWTPEEFSVRWEDVISSGQTGDRTVIAWAEVSSSAAPRLIIQDLASHPDLSAAELGADISAALIRVDLVANYDRDDNIDSDDMARVATNETFYFWINDDDDAGYDGGSDNPGIDGAWWNPFDAEPDCEDDEINGEKDFVDFMPVHVDIADAIELLGMSEYSYWMKHADSSLKALLPTNIPPGKCDRYLNETNFCLPNKEADLEDITSSGYQLPDAFLASITNGLGGVLILEGCESTTAPLVIEVRDSSSAVICSAELALSISGVTNMYRTLDLQGSANPEVEPPTIEALPEPSNFPDRKCSSKNFIFVHGYAPVKEGKADMTNWLAEIFKRMFWSGSQAKYHGVLWFSEEGDPMDYQKNVINAFETASNLCDYASILSGDIAVAAHSLGNVVVSSAIVDHGMAADHYFLCDAAVASEAYDAFSPQTNNLVHEWWGDYSSRTWAANWHELFVGSGDTRADLTWRDIFADIVLETDAINFYSSGDEVFELLDTSSLLSGVFGVEVSWWFIVPIAVDVDVDFARASWQKQEVFKGGRYSTGWTSIGGTPHAGWGYESTLVDSGGGETWDVIPIYTNAAGANAASDEDLRGNPIFKHYPAWLVGTNALDRTNIVEMLAMGIPALSSSAGQTSVDAIGSEGVSQYNLNGTTQKPNGWPRLYEMDDEPRWLHNDMKSMAYLYTYWLFEKMTEEGALYE